VLFYAQPDKALEQYKKAVSLNPRNAYAYDGQSYIYYTKHEYDKALEMSKEARDLAPWNPTFTHNYANDLMMNKRYEEAIKEYSDVTQLDPDFIYPYNDLAYVYRLSGNVSQERYWNNLSWSRWYYEQYIAMLNEEKITSLERNSDPVGILTGNSDGSVVTLVELSDKRYHAYYSLALTLYLMGHTDDAKKYVNKANELQLDPYLETQVKGALQYDIGLLPEEQEYFLGNLPSSSENSWLSRPN
jgi:tetratricopeptide (TPR) repeat protein